MLLPSQVYSTGIESPSAKAAEEIASDAISELSGSNSVLLPLPEPHEVKKIAVASTIGINENVLI